MSTQTQELEALEAKLRAAEERLDQAKGNTPPRRKDSQRRTPIQGVFPDQDKAQMKSPRNQATTNGTHTKQDASGARSATPSSENSADYVLVESPSA